MDDHFHQLGRPKVRVTIRMGDASYWSYSAIAGAEEDLVWGYPEPIEYSKDIAGHMAFDTRRVSMEVEPLEA